MKLRIPLYIFLLGIFAGIIQIFYSKISMGYSFLSGLLFYSLLGITIFILEKTEIVKKEVNPFIGVGIVVVGIIIDYFLH